MMDKKNLPYNILLAVALAATGLMVLYNLYLRDSFSIIVRYNFPSVQSREETAGDIGGGAFTEREPEIEEEAYEDAPENTPAVFYVEPEKYDEYDEGDIYWDGDDVIEVQFPLDINTATINELRLIPGVGDVTAQRITQYRDYLGGYTELEELMEIKGIGEKTFESIAPYLYVRDWGSDWED